MADSIGSTALLMTANPGPFLAGIQAAVDGISRLAAAQGGLGEKMPDLKAPDVKIEAGAGIGTLVGQMAAALPGAKELTTVFGALGGIFTGATGGLMGFVGAVQQAIGAIGGLVNQGMRLVGGQASMARQFGITTQAAAGLLLQGQLRGMGFDEVRGSLNKVTRVFGQLQAGEPAVTAAFARLGLSAGDVAGLPLDSALGRVGDRLAAITSPTQRAATAAAIFGRSWAEVESLTRGGTARIQGAQNLAQTLGITTNQEDAFSVRRAQHATRGAQAALQSVGNSLMMSLGIGFAPLVSGVSNAITQMVIAAQPMLQPLRATLRDLGAVATSVILPPLQTVVTTFGYMSSGVGMVLEGVRALGPFVRLVGDGFSAIGEAVTGVAGSLGPLLGFAATGAAIGGVFGGMVPTLALAGAGIAALSPLLLSAAAGAWSLAAGVLAAAAPLIPLIAAGAALGVVAGTLMQISGVSFSQLATATGELVDRIGDWASRTADVAREYMGLETAAARAVRAAAEMPVQQPTLAVQDLERINPTTNLTGQAGALVGDIRQQTAEWELQQRTLGMSAAQAQIFRLEMRAAQLSAAEAGGGVRQEIERQIGALQQLAGATERAAERQRLLQQAQQVGQQTGGPLNTFNARMTELNRLAETNTISMTDYSLATMQAFEAMDQLNNAQTSGPAGLFAGSSQAISAINRFRREQARESQDPQERVRQAIERQTEVQRETARRAGELVEAMRRTGVVTVADL